jgi:polyphosphate kinase
MATKQAPPLLTDGPRKSGPYPDLPVLSSDLYFNRELSWLQFNRRVLDKARDTDLRLLERLKFSAIFSTNLNEFFMIRVAGVRRKVVANITDVSTDGRTPVEQLNEIHKLTQVLLKEQAELFGKHLVPELAGQNIHLIPHDKLSKSERAALEAVFEREIFPVLTPQAVDRGRRFPHISNDSLNLLVALKSKHGTRFARVKVPALLPRFVPVPASKPEGATGRVLVGQPEAARQSELRFTWLEQVITAHLDRLFPGSEVLAAYPFHLLRDSDVEPDEDDDDHDDLLEIMRETLSQRPFGSVVRIDVDKTMPRELCSWLLEQVRADARDLYVVDGPLNNQDLFELTKLDRPDLKDPHFVPAQVFRTSDTSGTSTVISNEELFALLREKDVFLHLPYQSFDGVVDFVRAASTDADVIAIKQTLYRIGSNSPLIPALTGARDDDTQVAVLVELKARFDEENNISWAQQLENYGVHVAYGLMGLKTHCKLTLVVRREEDGLRRYVHIATGNYNANTARIYEDLAILSSREDLANDVTELFNTLTGYAEHVDYESIWVAPHDLRRQLIEAIFEEIRLHQEHGNGHLIFKMNSLVDRETIRALYAASRAGVRVDLIIRGICCLRPGVPGFSETMRVVSVVGRFLEHSRIYWFNNAGKPMVYIGSADAMERNFDRRVEVVTPVASPEIGHYIRHTVLEGYLRDNVNARILQRDGSYLPVKRGQDDPVYDDQAEFTRLYRDGPVTGSNT